MDLKPVHVAERRLVVAEGFDAADLRDAKAVLDGLERGRERRRPEIVREYGRFSGVDHVHGVTYDGRNVWLAAGDKPGRPLCHSSPASAAVRSAARFARTTR